MQLVALPLLMGYHSQIQLHQRTESLLQSSQHIVKWATGSHPFPSLELPLTVLCQGPATQTALPWLQNHQEHTGKTKDDKTL